MNAIYDAIGYLLCSIPIRLVHGLDALACRERNSSYQPVTLSRYSIRLAPTRTGDDKVLPLSLLPIVIVLTWDGLYSCRIVLALIRDLPLLTGAFRVGR